MEKMYVGTTMFILCTQCIVMMLPATVFAVQPRSTYFSLSCTAKKQQKEVKKKEKGGKQEKKGEKQENRGEKLPEVKQTISKESGKS